MEMAYDTTNDIRYSKLTLGPLNSDRPFPDSDLPRKSSRLERWEEGRGEREREKG